MYYQRTHWHNATQYFGVTIFRQFEFIANYDRELVNAAFLPNVLAFSFAIGLLAYAYAKKLNATYIVYTLGYVFISFSPAWLLSGARYTVACVPLFIFLAHAAHENKFLRFTIPVIFLAGLFAMLRTFILGGPVF
jgi:ribose/xylose/arabinose/galactoside ABC-type transport system permease subunit